MLVACLSARVVLCGSQGETNTDLVNGAWPVSAAYTATPRFRFDLTNLKPSFLLFKIPGAGAEGRAAVNVRPNVCARVGIVPGRAQQTPAVQTEES